MANIRPRDMRLLEDAFGMGSGYVLDFTRSASAATAQDGPGETTGTEFGRPAKSPQLRLPARDGPMLTKPPSEACVAVGEALAT